MSPLARMNLISRLISSTEENLSSGFFLKAFATTLATGSGKDGLMSRTEGASLWTC